MKNNNFEYYITVFIIWIILILGIFYLYTNISSTLYWNTEVKNIYEQFNTLQNQSNIYRKWLRYPLFFNFFFI